MVNGSFKTPLVTEYRFSKSSIGMWYTALMCSNAMINTISILCKTTITISFNPFHHQVHPPGVAYEPNIKTNKPAWKHIKGSCALYFMECLIITPSPLQDNQSWKTLFTSMQQSSHKPHHLLTPPGHLIMRSVMHVFTVFLAIGPNISRTLLCYTDCIILAVTGHSYSHTNITSYELWIVWAIFSVDLFYTS